MEYSILIGMGVAFVLGAFIRKPFEFKAKLKLEEKVKELEMQIQDLENKKDEKASNWEELMNYTGDVNEN